DELSNGNLRVARNCVKQPTKPFDKSLYACRVVDAGIKARTPLMLRIVLVKVHAEAPRHGFCKPFQPCHLETAEFYRPMMMGNTENHRNLRHIRTLVEELVPQFLIRDCPSQLDFYDPSSNKAEPLAKRCVRLVVKSQCRKVGEIPEHVLQFDAIAICNISAN